MSDRVKCKSGAMEFPTARHGKRKKSKKRSSSNDCALVTAQRKSCSKEKRRKSRGKKSRKSSTGNSSSDDSGVARLKRKSKPERLPGEFPEFCRKSEERRNDALTGEHLSAMERKVLVPPLVERGRKREANDRSDPPEIVEKLKKSQKRRRSSSRSSFIGDGSSCRTSGSSDDSSVSSASSDAASERRRRRKKRKKKKLAKKMMKREEEKRRDERRRTKRIMKEKSGISGEEIKPKIIEATHDRLLNDISIELADRARAMAPMTREQWEKKQSVIRRVYDEETGRQRLIKGDGEVLEEIVSRDRHMAINKKATKGDGEFFQSRLLVKK